MCAVQQSALADVFGAERCILPHSPPQPCISRAKRGEERRSGQTRRPYFSALFVGLCLCLFRPAKTGRAHTRARGSDLPTLARAAPPTHARLWPSQSHATPTTSFIVGAGRRRCVIGVCVRARRFGAAPSQPLQTLFQIVCQSKQEIGGLRMNPTKPMQAAESSAVLR